MSARCIKHCWWINLLTVSFSISLRFCYYQVFRLVYISFAVLYFLYIVCVVHVLPFGVINNINIISDMFRTHFVCCFYF